MTIVSDTVDARISYPSYKSFDEFIDVEWLKSLDGYVAERVRRRLEAQKDYQFYTGPFLLKEETPDRPGSDDLPLAVEDA